ncbi:MAG: TrmH family RNA methyltransferase [Muribaculaceae bacterium]|nr:TrmH family RNA methyltransferase [Muribaculaceae bacterium]
MKKKSIWDMGRLSTEEFRRADKLPVVVVLDNVRSLNNIGSLFRTADCFAVAGIALCGISATPPSPEIHKTALGAEDSVAWSYYPRTADAIADLRSRGYSIICLEQVMGSVALQDFRPKKGTCYALVLGNEVDGVDQAIVDAADIWLEIPQSGTKHSLNVTISASIALWHIYSHSPIIGTV